jgi:hypothetical protein
MAAGAAICLSLRAMDYLSSVPLVLEEDALVTKGRYDHRRGQLQLANLLRAGATILGVLGLVDGMMEVLISIEWHTHHTPFGAAPSVARS